MSKNKITITISFLSLLCFNACKKFVEIKPPTTSLVTASVFTDNSKAIAAQLVIYAQMQTYPANIDWATGLSSDELRNYVTSTSAVNMNLYTNSLNASIDGSKISLWSQPYNLIYEANAILEALPNSDGLTDAVKKQLTGESKFIRAFWYFYLVNLYGDVPLILSTDYIVNSKLARTPKSQVYQQIIADLTDAQNLLTANYIDAAGTTTVDRVRPTKWAATALLGRVYLYTGNTGDWAKAEAAATSVINNTPVFSLPSDLNTVFLKTSPEAIWQLLPNSNNKYTTEGAFFILTSSPTSPAGSYTNTLSDQLLNAFEPGDLRKTTWVDTFTSGTNNWYFANKYKATTTSTLLTEYSMVLRLAEQYLIRAEVKALQNNIGGAIADLNLLRARARATPTPAVPNPLPDLSNSLSQSQVLAAILHERQVELFTEGHRWFDLKRTNQVDAVMNTVTPQKGGTWKSFQQFYPIPPADVQNSAGIITQTLGY